MENIFNTKNNQQETTPLDIQYDNLKDNYEKIFIEAAESIRASVNKFKPKDACSNCTIKDCNIDKKDVFTTYPIGCVFNNWQKQILNYLSGEYKQQLKNAYKTIMEEKNEYSCAKCGNCCRLATSEYSYEQLKQKAMRGDKFSKEFISVFVPYKTEEEAKLANPEYFKLLNDLMEDEKIYYYHCPKIVGNECSDYENRPSICKNFPHSPLKLLPSSCSFNVWKNSIAKRAMLLNAKIDIIEFYKSKLS